MSLDRFFKPTRETPTPEQVFEFITLFFNGAGIVGWKSEGIDLIIALPGKPANAGAHFMGLPCSFPGSRWIEVWLAGEIDVLTRGADPYTNTLADGLYDYMRRFWGSPGPGGTYQPDDQE
jgi:hypothetical protein